MRLILFSLLTVTLLTLTACDDSNSSANNDTTCANPWVCDDPEGRTTEGNILDTGPVMLIVTSEELAEKWQEYADIRSIQGVYTEVVTMTTVRETSEGADDAEKLRSYLRSEYENGNLQFALLGGDADQVPFRRVENEISIVMTGDDYTSNAPSQLYFSNLEVDFHGDGDGIPGERDEDFGVEEARVSHIAVGRISVESVTELHEQIRQICSHGE